MRNTTSDHSLGNLISANSSTFAKHAFPLRENANVRSYVHSALTPTLSNYRINLFHELVGALDDMAKLQSDDDFYVDNDIKVAAIKVLSFVCQTDLDLPKILPEGSDCLSFTWDAGDLRGFLTIYNDELEYTVYRRSSGVRCVKNVNFDGELGYDEVGKAIAVKPKVTTAS